MSRSIEELESEVLSLSTKDREQLLETIIASLETEDIAEAERRAEEMISGAETGIPVEEMFASLRARTG